MTYDMTYKDYCKRYGWIPPIAKLLKRALLSYQVAEKFTDPHWENYWDPLMVLSPQCLAVSICMTCWDFFFII